jgi:hypothetical protein
LFTKLIPLYALKARDGFESETQLTLEQVATGRKSALMSVIGCRTDKTDLGGVMEEDDGYEHITVFSELKQ